MKLSSLFYTVFLTLFVAAPLCATTRESEMSLFKERLGKKLLNKELRAAIFDGAIAKVENLLAQGADVNALKYDGSAALHVAAQEGHVELVRLLVGAGADVNAVMYDGATALLIAAQEGHVEVVRLLLALKANVNLAMFDSGFTALHAAVENGHTEVVRLLCLVADIDVMARMYDETTPFVMAINRAIQNKHFDEITQLLIIAGAGLDVIAEEEKITILDYARIHKLPNIEGAFELITTFFENPIEIIERIKRLTRDEEKEWVKTLLTQSVLRGRKDLIKMLIQTAPEEFRIDLEQHVALAGNRIMAGNKSVSLLKLCVARF
jgi:ankyrin repeat protein